ncbi:YlzJ-like family protein [Heyndrickxia oleronia]|uniref:YlzJ-like family protein n=1 Tax=Heyndrickxia oleronia TaxID=38875 RepID=A0AAW6SVG6_9BACI|nr:YlzJ-like family protein [Heyndrickxia oleronia]MDH5161252.1 YlzJ-like family protein [Heyndrickxia oleronia]
MILYTTVPQELIFQTDASEYSKYKTIVYNNVPMLVEQLEHNYRIVRILSSNPVDFLNRELNPGQMISFF